MQSLSSYSQRLYFSACSGFSWSRKNLHLFDLTYVTSLRLINEVVFQLFSRRPFSDQKTYREQQWDREVSELRVEMSHKRVVTTFCHETAACVHAIVRKLAGGELRKVPHYLENMAYYLLGFPFRYAYRQFTKRGGREQVLNFFPAPQAGGLYGGFSTRFAHSVTEPTLHSLVNIELIFLNVCRQLTGGPSDLVPLKKVLFERLAKSLSQQEAMKKKCEEMQSEGEKKIAAWDWLKKNKDLPAGLPNPDEGVFPENLPQKEYDALYRYFSSVIQKLLDRCAPQSVKTGLAGAVYELEGRDATVHLLTELVIQTLINQIADPDKFAQIILSSQGEVMDIELDGYGIRKEDAVFDTGKEILKAFQERKSLAELSEILRRSELKAAPGGGQGNEQKLETKKRLKQFFAGIFLQMLQKQESDPTLEKSHDPIYGAGSIGWQLLHGVMETGIRQLKKFNVFAAQRIERYIAGFFADKMVDLIYHPSWKIVLLQMFQALMEHWEGKNQPKKDFDKNDFDAVTGFLGEHFFGAIEASQIPAIHPIQTVTWALGQALDYYQVSPVDQSMGKYISDAFLYLKSDELFDLFKEHMHAPPQRSLLEDSMQSLIPTLKETSLYCKMVDTLRKQGKAIESDEKFWEIFIRYSLAERVKEMAKLRSKKLSHEGLVAIREEIIEGLLIQDESEMVATLCKIPRSNKIKAFDMNQYLDPDSLEKSWVSLN